jgi:hypothetical protein
LTYWVFFSGFTMTPAADLFTFHTDAGARTTRTPGEVPDGA